jgi:hypothetical protein
MKLQHFIYLILFLEFRCLAGQLTFPLIRPECQNDIIVTADPEHPKPCPPEYTNLLSNTNLFSSDEEQLLKLAGLKYKDVTTNSGAEGAIFEKFELRQWTVGKTRIRFPVACFIYTNSPTRDEVANYGGTIIIISRDLSGDGYNIQISHGKLLQFQEYKNGELDGFCVALAPDDNRCSRLAHFVNGKIIGKFITWNRDGEINMEAEFKEPFDFLKCTLGKFDLTWEKITRDSTDSREN